MILEDNTDYTHLEIKYGDHQLLKETSLLKLNTAILKNIWSYSKLGLDHSKEDIALFNAFP